MTQGYALLRSLLRIGRWIVPVGLSGWLLLAIITPDNPDWEIRGDVVTPIVQRLLPVLAIILWFSTRRVRQWLMFRVSLGLVRFGFGPFFHLGVVELLSNWAENPAPGWSAFEALNRIYKVVGQRRKLAIAKAIRNMAAGPRSRIAGEANAFLETIQRAPALSLSEVNW